MHIHDPRMMRDRRRFRSHVGPAASCLLAGALLTVAVLLAPTQTMAAGCCDPNSPFREGEGVADEPATCENMAYWADRAPDTDDRITLSIKGKLSWVSSDGALAYLVMCDKPGVQVLCVTYETNGMQAGEVVSFAGSYERRGEKRIVMDPCLASRE